ncbi:MAG TPA: hypothetical protein VJH24_03540 [Candidatus Bilamarchaeaceae archaeon]|nr:hypothetical protein [Candidatus Bilamarchaeaceae archaeon]
MRRSRRAWVAAIALATGIAALAITRWSMREPEVERLQTAQAVTPPKPVPPKNGGGDGMAKATRPPELGPEETVPATAAKKDRRKKEPGEGGLGMVESVRLPLESSRDLEDMPLY